MNTEDQKDNIAQQQSGDKTVKKPKIDEVPGLNVEARFKIFDPITGKVLVKGRG